MSPLSASCSVKRSVKRSNLYIAKESLYNESGSCLYSLAAEKSTRSDASERDYKLV